MVSVLVMSAPTASKMHIITTWTYDVKIATYWGTYQEVHPAPVICVVAWVDNAPSPERALPLYAAPTA